MGRSPSLPAFATLGQRILWWRKHRGLSRPELAIKAKMPYSTLAGLEDGDQTTTTKITQLSAALGLNPHYLATDKGDPENLTATPSTEGWPFRFPRELFEELEPNDRELAEYRFLRILDEIKAGRSRAHSHKVKRRGSAV